MRWCSRRAGRCRNRSGARTRIATRARKGADFVDGENQLWDHKIATSEFGFDAKAYVAKIKRNDIGAGEKIMLNHEKLTTADRRKLLAEIDEQGLRSHFRFLPPL